MNYNFGNIPFIQILEFLAAGIALFLIFNFVGRYIIPLLADGKPSANPWWQRFLIVSWSVYFVLFYSTLLRSYPSMTLILTIVILLLSWEYWRNMFSGVLIKFTGQFAEGDFISTDLVKGTLKRIYLSRSEFSNEKGELVKVPNYDLKNQVVTYLHKTHDANICIFNVKTNDSQTLDEIYQMAYNCPYIAVNQEITVERNSRSECLVKATIIDNSFIDSTNRYFEDSVDLGRSVSLGN